MKRKAAKPRKKARARAKAVTRRGDAVETALAALAHEVRTPLNGILAFGELLAASQLPERERGWAAGIKSAAEHLAQLTSVIVDGTKADRATLVLRAAPFRPQALAEAVAASLRARAEAKGLATDVTIAGDLPDWVMGDAVRLRAALENLVDNAVKFTERGEVALHVTARAAGRARIRLVFIIGDSGIGLSAAEMKRLFRPFAQASDAIASRFGGAGLGLTFVKRIANAMGGDLAIESAPGRGSRFSLEAVVAKPSARAREGGGATQARVAAAPARSLHVLCVEDNPYGRVVLNTILGELGHRVDFVDSGKAGVEAVGRSAYDVVLMDITLPDIDGMTATRLIRGLATAAARVPVIGISGHTEVNQEAVARAAGMNAYLVKPVSPAALAALLNEINRSARRVGKGALRNALNMMTF